MVMDSGIARIRWVTKDAPLERGLRPLSEMPPEPLTELVTKDAPLERGLRPPSRRRAT